mmetsp:Transcript_50281/g.114117  ORF Transcript_50281/g.114117 Transcript_50281/m.114117 type:complete len:215 (+) Transcript_50281:16-660(+)
MGGGSSKAKASDKAAKSSVSLPAKPTPTPGLEADTKDWKKLHSACRWGKRADFEAMLGPSNLNSVDDQNGNCPIHIAAQNGHLDLVELLLSKSCNVNAQNNGGQTALHMAMEYDYYDCISKLVESGADKTLKNTAGHEAWKGIDGGKVYHVVALGAAKSSEDYLKFINLILADDDAKARIDKAELVQIRMKVSLPPLRHAQYPCLPRPTSYRTR